MTEAVELKEKHRTTDDQKVLLEVKNLKTYFPIKSGKFKRTTRYVKAVDDVSFYVKKGETLGIVGESGCGKSTTGNSIIRLVEPTSGEVFFNGENIASVKPKDFRPHKKNIQMIFQDPFSSLNPRMHVFDIIAEPLVTHKLYKGKELEKRVVELMEIVGLDPELLHRYPHEFSGGQRQRIGIARAIALNPELIICDEPVSALDVSIQAQVLNLLKRLQKELDLTYVFIAHGIPAVKYVSDRIAVMYMGEIVEVTTNEKLFSNTLHPYTKRLISAVPSTDPTKRTIGDSDAVADELNQEETSDQGCKFAARCPFAQDNCLVDRPKLREYAKGHYVKCHYPLKH
ncbi:oligopeptide/dipeptide ABC transporter ATP-binding protein [Ornithinibacillus caprae]|uniref:ABC transporter ATP-binding protein n=1 Tax=Ornithinibacillus caprae TaxID=2678566 RepID=UPI0031B641D5